MHGMSSGKKRTILVVGSCTALALLASLVIRLLDRGPAFYRRPDQLSVEDRQAQSRQFLRQTTSIWNQVENDPAWSGTIRDSQVNAWLAVDFALKHSDVLPVGVSDPRISFDDGRLAMAFRKQLGPLATVVSARGRIWLPESNLVAIELDSLRAGVFPIPAGVVVGTVTSAAKSMELDLEWRSHAGKPVALIRLARPEDQPRVSIDNLELKCGMLYLAGHSREQKGPTGHTVGSPKSESTEVSRSDQSSEAPLQR